MATITKATTGTSLSTGASWVGGVAPGASDTAYWQTTSLGGTLTGAISPLGVQIDGATADITYTTNTLSLGTGGLTFGPANNRRLNVTTGVISVGANNQTWALCHTTQASNIGLSGAGALTGSATINITNNSGIASNGYAYILPAGAQAGFTGTFVMQDYTAIAVSGASNLTAANITIDGTGVTLYNANVSGDVLGAAGKTLTINNDTTLGITATPARSFTIPMNVALGSVARTLNVASTGATGLTLSGPITGTAGFTKAGAGTLTLSVANPSLSGDVAVSAGNLATSTSVNALQAATLNWTGTVGTFSPLTNSNIGAIKGSTTTNTLALGTSAINVGGANTSETFSGKFTGSGLITKNGTGTWTLDGDNSGHTGGFTVGTSGAGTLVAGSAAALGAASAGAVSVVSGSTLQVNAAVSKSSATLTLAGTGISGNGALRSLSGTTSYTASGYTITSDVNIGVDAGTMTLGGAGAVMGTGGITKVGAGELVLQGESNTLDRQIAISAGTLTVKKLADAGVVSSLGRGNTTPAIALTGTLKFDGTGTDSTNRAIAFTGAAPVLEATGAGSITYSASTTTGLTGGRLITLTGTSTSANALTSGLADGAGAVSLAKTGTGTWNLTGTLAHTGGTTLSAGTLGALGSTATYAANLNISGGTLANGTITAPVVMTGGSVTATLASTSTLTVSSGTATLQPTANANTFTGATTVSSGATLQLVTAATDISTTGGKVLGNSNVSVAGSIKTYGDTVQKGQMRYGGNLTFQAGAKLYVGSATP